MALQIRHFRHGAGIALVALLLGLTGLACSKSDSARTTGSEDQDGSRSSSGDQDNSAFAPADVAGSFLTAVQQCRKFIEGTSILIGCALVDQRSGERVLAKFASQLSRVDWTMFIDGKPLPGGRSPGGSSLAASTQDDQIWVLGAVGMTWPKRISPKVQVVLKDGTPLENAKVSAASSQILKTAPDASGSGGESLVGPVDSTSAVIFVTKDEFPSPSFLRGYPEQQSPKLQSCPYYQRALEATNKDSFADARLFADTVCNCMAGDPQTVEAVRARQGSFYAVGNFEPTTSLFAAFMVANQTKDLFGLDGVRVAGRGQLFLIEPISQVIRVNMLAPFFLDESGHSALATSGAVSVAWTGLDLNGEVVTPRDGLPNCRGWAPKSDPDSATSG